MLDSRLFLSTHLLIYILRAIRDLSYGYAARLHKGIGVLAASRRQRHLFDQWSGEGESRTKQTEGIY